MIIAGLLLTLGVLLSLLLLQIAPNTALADFQIFIIAGIFIVLGAVIVYTL